jgi:uncharacterized protein (DUF2147 family)
MKQLPKWVVAAAAGCAILVSQGRSAAADVADSPVGYWTTIDDDGKTASSTVQLYLKGGKLHGKVVEILDPKQRDAKCTDCSGSRRNQPVLGMEILWGMERDGDEWSGGRILDPNNGSEYRCIMKVEQAGKSLKVRGYIGLSIIGRTQYWHRGRQPKSK